jgi:predicted PurR-regulated permease PerM
LIVNLLFKIIFFYFIYTVIKSIFKTAKALKHTAPRYGGQQDYSGQSDQWQGESPRQQANKDHQNLRDIEADFRVVRESD